MDKKRRNQKEKENENIRKEIEEKEITQKGKEKEIEAAQKKTKKAQLKSTIWICKSNLPEFPPEFGEDDELVQ